MSKKPVFSYTKWKEKRIRRHDSPSDAYDKTEGYIWAIYRMIYKEKHLVLQ